MHYTAFSAVFQDDSTARPRAAAAVGDIRASRSSDAPLGDAMDFPLKTGEPARQRTECAILPVFDDGELRGATKALDKAARGAIKQIVRAGDAAGRLGATALIHRTQGVAARW